MEKKLSINQKKMIMWLLIIVSMIVAFFFCTLKQGYHFDEYYSYYSTNVSEGMWLPDNGWRSGASIAGEFMASDGEALGLDVVRISQSYDVHPPMYYFVLRVFSFLTKGIFSKWQGLAINLIFYFISLIILGNLADLVSDGNPVVVGFTLALTGLSPVVLSTVMMIRMYSMLTCECMLVIYICVRAVKLSKYNWGHLIVPMMLLSFFGFMTHYYFIIFMFFVAAFMCIYMFIDKVTRVRAFILGFSICFGIGVGVLYYPYCYSHIFKGYRGNEATSAFFDINNTLDRLGFYTGIINDYAFSGLFYLLVLAIILLYVFCRFKKVSSTKKTAVPVYMLLTVSIGYFLVVSKTAPVLSNPVEAMRYHAPIYMLVILLVTMGIYYPSSKIGITRLAVAVLVLSTGVQVYGLSDDRVFFLYREDVQDYAFSEEHSEDCIIYIYNPSNRWMVWDDSQELMNYNNIYFISTEFDGDIDDEIIRNTDRIYVYACRSDQSENIIERILSANNRLNSYDMCSPRLYADIYELSD